MKVLIDANVALDWLTKRAPSSELSIQALRECLDRGDEGYLSATSIDDIFYVLRKHYQDKKIAKEKVAAALSLFDVASVDGEAIRNAMLVDGKDFEDDICLSVALSMGADCILTNNKKDFSKDQGITIYSPEEYLALRGS